MLSQGMLSAVYLVR